MRWWEITEIDQGNVHMHPKFKTFDGEKPVILVLVGVPYSGKSTWIKSFLANRGADWVTLSTDDNIHAMAAQMNADKGIPADAPNAHSYNRDFQDLIRAATQQMAAKARQSFNGGKNIIWDQTNLGAKKRKGIIQDADRAGYYKVAVVFQVPDNAEMKRRYNSRTSHSVPWDILQNMLQNWNKPGAFPQKSEGFDVVISDPSEMLKPNLPF